MQICLWAPTLNELRGGRNENQLTVPKSEPQELASDHFGVHISVLSAEEMGTLVCLLKKLPECTLLHKLTKSGGSGIPFGVSAGWFEL